MKNMKYKKSFFALVLIVGLLFINMNSELLLVNPFSSITLSDIVFATKDGNDNQVIIDSSGQRVIRLDDNNKVNLVILGDSISGDGFKEAKRVITDRDNNIFVYSIIKENSGYRVQTEEIIEYSAKGKLVGTVVSIQHDTPVLVGQMLKMLIYEGQIAYCMNDKISFSIFDKGNSLIHTYPFEKGVSSVVNFAFDENLENIYYASKHGEVYQYNEFEDDTVIYESKEKLLLSIPREVTVDQEGNVYFSDIGLRVVSKIMPEGIAEPVIYEGVVGEDIVSKYIYYFANANNGLIAVTTDYTASVIDGELSFTESAPLNQFLFWLTLFMWLILLMILVIGIYFLIKIGRFIKYKGSKVFIITASTILAVALVACTLLLIVLPDFQGRLLDSELNRAQAISSITSMLLPKEAYKNIDSPSDYLEEDYLAVRETVNGIFLSESSGISDFYCVLYSIQNGAITLSYSLQEDIGANYPYDWEFEDSDEEEIINTGEGKVYREFSTNEGSFLFVLNPIVDEDGTVIGLIEVGKDLEAFNELTNKMIFELFLNVFVMTIVVVLVALEFIIFNKGRQEYKVLKKERKDKKGSIVLPVDLLRIIAFGIFFVTNMTTSFLPLYAMRIAESEVLFSIPKEVYAAIPIAAEVAFGALFSIFGTFFIRKLGHKGSAIFGSILFTLGLFIRLLLPNIWLLTLGNAIIGSGWGIILLLLNTLIANSKGDEKNKGFAGQNAAALSGISCGIVFGGFLINWLSYSMVFIIAAIISLNILLHVIRYFTYSVREVNANRDLEEAKMNIIGFLLGKGVLGFFIMIVLPVIAGGYFLYYMFPILGNEYGLSESYVGYAYLIIGLCVILFSGLLTEYFVKKISKQYALVLSALLYAVAFISVANYQNISALLLALILLGLADSFGLPIQTSYYTDIESVKKYGYERAMGVYSLFENIAQTGGSFIFSYVLLIGVKNGLIVVALTMTILAGGFALIYMLGSRKRQQSAIA